MQESSGRQVTGQSGNVDCVIDSIQKLKIGAGGATDGTEQYPLAPNKQKAKLGAATMGGEGIASLETGFAATVTQSEGSAPASAQAANSRGPALALNLSTGASSPQIPPQSPRMTMQQQQSVPQPGTMQPQLLAKQQAI